MVKEWLKGSLMMVDTESCWFNNSLRMVDRMVDAAATVGGSGWLLIYLHKPLDCIPFASIPLETVSGFRVAILAILIGLTCAASSAEDFSSMIAPHRWLIFLQVGDTLMGLPL